MNDLKIGIIERGRRGVLPIAQEFINGLIAKLHDSSEAKVVLKDGTLEKPVMASFILGGVDTSVGFIDAVGHPVTSLEQAISIAIFKCDLTVGVVDGDPLPEPCSATLLKAFDECPGAAILSTPHRIVLQINRPISDITRDCPKMISQWCDLVYMTLRAYGFLQ
jgi:hypothetical protein